MSVDDRNRLLGDGSDPRGGYGDGYADADMFDLSGFVRVFTGAVRHHRFLIGVTAGLTVLAAVSYALVWPPTYQVQAQIAAERDLDPSRDVFYANWQVFRKADARDEMVLFTSGPVLREVIEENDLHYEDVYHPFMSHLGYLWRSSWPGRQYRAVKEWISPPAVETTPEQEDFGRTMDGLEAGIRIAGEQDSYIATVTVKGPNPGVHVVANSLIDNFLEYRREQFAGEAQTAYDALTEETERAREQLDEIVARREAFAAENGLLVEFQKESQDVRELTMGEKRIADLQSQISALRASITEVEAQLRNEPPEKVLSSIRELNPVRETAKLRQLELETMLINLRSRYREDSPEVQDAVAELRELEALIASEPEHIDRSVTQGINSTHQQLVASRAEMRSQLEGALAALHTTEGNVDALRARLASFPSLFEESTNLNRLYGVASEKYQRLLLRRMEAEVSATAAGAAPSSVKVVDYAAPATGKHWPRLKILLPAALIFGLALGVIAAVLRSLTAGRLLRSHMDRGRVGGGVYATIPVGGWVPSLTLVNGRRTEAPALPLPEGKPPGAGSSP